MAARGRRMYQFFEEQLQRSGLPFILTEHNVESAPRGLEA
jgi:hypothetical protein